MAAPVRADHHAPDSEHSQEGKAGGSDDGHLSSASTPFSTPAQFFPSAYADAVAANESSTDHGHHFGSATKPPQHFHHAPGRAVHHRQRGGGAVFVLRDALHPDYFHDELSHDERGQARSHERGGGAGVFRAFLWQAVYFLPIAGAILAEAFLGKYKTIFWLSIVYCAGHFMLALDDTRTGLMIGLGLIALGSGGIKPCVSAHVGDQFGKTNHHLLSKIYNWFYFSINFWFVLLHAHDALVC